MIRPVRAQIIRTFWIMIVVLALLSIPTWVGAEETFVHNDPAFTFKHPSNYKPDAKFRPEELYRVRDKAKAGPRSISIACPCNGKAGEAK